MQRILFGSRQRHISLLSRVWSGNTGIPPKYTESELCRALKVRFPKANNIVVTDVSGGCGAMYEIYVQTDEFKGLSTIKQHRLITDTLKNEIKDMHGLRIYTEVPR